MNISHRIFIRALLLVSCLFGASNLNAGVSDETLVQTQDGPKPIRILKIGDKILCSNMQNLSVEERAISAIEEVEAPRVVEITTSDNVTFYVAADQKLFVTHKWIEAQQLTLEDVLLTKDRTFVKVVAIRHLEKPMTLRFITVDEHHNFFAAENGVLVHNAAVGAAVGVAVGATAVQATYGAATYIIGATATVIAGPAVAAGVVTAWGYWTFVPLMATTKVVACATGIALAVATGPI